MYKVVDKSTNKTTGHVSFISIDKYKNSARIGTILVGNKKKRNKEIGQKIVKEILRIGFEEFKFRRIELGVFGFNKPATTCYKKLELG